jgi:phosphoribosylformimino-5-aminoimidazole carboxamide ribotide isomerase
VTELVPAIDLLEGAVVRLHQGDYAKVTRYPLDPLAHAAALRGKVARLHVVDLAGARSGAPTQHDFIKQLCNAFGPGVQVGGGVRDRARAESLLEAGASRVVLGTAAVRDPELVRVLCEAHPGAVILAVDAKDGVVAIDGWTQASGMSAVDVARRFDGLQLDSLLYTDVSRDGTRVGPAVDATIALARESRRPVLASGGVGALDHLRALSHAPGVLGVIVGRALLDGVFSIDGAIAALRGHAG